jgi:hypothetical protein
MSKPNRGTEPEPSLYGSPLLPAGVPLNRSVGRTVDSGPYRYEYSPDHPDANLWGYCLQHRLVAEAVLGRHLAREERIHHENGDKRDNTPSNLWLFPNQAEHMRFHKRGCPKYSPGLTSRLRVLAADRNVNLEQAAKNLGLCVSTVKAMLRLHRIEWVSPGRCHLTTEQVREALHGRTTLEASQLLGVTHQTLRNLFPHLLRKRVSPMTLEDQKEQIHSLATKMRCHELAEMFGVHLETVRKAIARWKRQEPDAWSDVSVFQNSRPWWGHKSRHTASCQ